MTYAINPNAKNVWIRDNEDTMDLSPITDASSVYLENGRTLEQELGEGSMVSNVTTVDGAMSKVIDGTYDGAYESLVFKGKSLVNLFDKSKVSPDHTGYTLGSDNTITYVANNGFTNGVKLNHLKPNTKYALFFDVLAVPQEPNIPYRINDDGTNYNINIFGTGQDNPTSGFHSFTTGNDVSDLKFYFYTNLRNVGFKLTLPVIIEYQDGMEDWDIPYFEGLCDVKMPILRNVGKNLFDINVYPFVDKVAYQEGNRVSWSGYCGITELFPVKPNTTYTFSNDLNKPIYFGIVFYDNNKTKVSYGHAERTTFTTPDNCAFIRFSIQSDVSPSWVQIEESSQQTTYEDYKTNILHTPEIVTLRSLPNGVRDELNLKTGEYIKRIGEVVLDGVNIKPKWIVQSVSNDVTSYFDFDGKFVGAKNVSYALSDKFNYENYLYNDDRTRYAEGIRIGGDGWGSIRIFNSKLETADYNGFVKWLQSNPVTVQYELAEPVITKTALTQSEPIVKIGTELPNGVCDTYNLLTGEHIQRVGKVVLDGSEVWTKVAFPSTNTTHCYSSLKIENLKMPNVNEKNIVSDRFQTVAQESYNYSNEEMYTWRTGELLYVNILRSRLSTSDVQGLKAWFKENPTTVWYELKNPIVTKKNGLPNTHGVTLPSGEVDKYNESTGVYTQNLGKVVLDGSQDEEWAIVSSLSLTNTIAFQCMLSQGSSSRADNLICNSFTPQEGSSDVEHIRSAWAEDGAYKAIALFINKTKLPTQDVSGLRSYLASNNIELYYSLPASKTIDIPLINVGQVLPNGVCDTYNPITKEYVKRVSGTVLVGNEDWSLMNSPYETDCIGFVTPCSLANWTQSQANLNIVCEGYVGNYELWNVDEEGFSVFKTPTRLAIKVKRSKLSTADINGFKKFLKLNPLAVWYELATPEVSTVDLDLSTLYSSSPVAYENGHIILESGHDGQSLLPTLEYSTVTNRVKQIESIGEQVLRQEKQLTMLEQMLIQNIIGLDYNNTVLALNLEINEVM